MSSPRQRAIEKGEKHYYTGALCKNGHRALRNTITCLCVECNRASQFKARKKVALGKIKAACGFIKIEVQCHAEVASLVRQFAEIASAWAYDSRRVNDIQVIQAVCDSLDAQYS